MRLALFQPNIPQNTGSILRLAACFGVGVDVIGPCGFPFSDRGLKRAGLDYAARATVSHHASWAAFQEPGPMSRLILMTTRGDMRYCDFGFQPGDTLMAGRESAGVPDEVHAAADARLLVPLVAGARSLNVAQACAIVLAEALRQTGGFAFAPE